MSGLDRSGLERSSLIRSCLKKSGLKRSGGKRSGTLNVKTQKMYPFPLLIWISTKFALPKSVLHKFLQPNHSKKMVVV
jgi:hypothetical protein